MVGGIGTSAFKDSYLDFAPQILAKLPPNAFRNTRNRNHTSNLSSMNYFIAYQYILETI